MVTERASTTTILVNLSRRVTMHNSIVHYSSRQNDSAYLQGMGPNGIASTGSATC